MLIKKPARELGNTIANNRYTTIRIKLYGGTRFTRVLSLALVAFFPERDDIVMTAGPDFHLRADLTLCCPRLVNRG